MAKAITHKTATSLVQNIAAQIRQRIKDGAYVPAQRLIESDLTQELAVSRGSLREAMWHLAGEGLVAIEPNRGVSVRGVSRQEAADIYRVREVLEGLAAASASAHIENTGNATKLKKIWRTLESAFKAGNVEQYMTANENFHDTIVALSGNGALQKLIADLRLPVFRLQFKSRINTEDMKSGHREHKLVYEAIYAGDAVKAEKAMRRHVHLAWKLIDALPDTAFAN